MKSSWAFHRWISVVASLDFILEFVQMLRKIDGFQLQVSCKDEDHD
jgi:hypothetical protein